MREFLFRLNIECPDEACFRIMNALFLESNHVGFCKRFVGNPKALGIAAGVTPKQFPSKINLLIEAGLITDHKTLGITSYAFSTVGETLFKMERKDLNDSSLSNKVLDKQEEIESLFEYPLNCGSSGYTGSPPRTQPNKLTETSTGLTAPRVRCRSDRETENASQEPKGERLAAALVRCTTERNTENVSPKPNLTPGAEKTAELWNSYADCMRSTHGYTPTRNAKVHSQLRMISDRLGNESVRVLQYFFSRKDQRFLTARHDPGLLLYNLHAIHGDMINKGRINPAQAKTMENLQLNQSAAEQAKKML